MIDLFSQTSYFLEVRFNDELLSTATCFFVRRDNELFLLTNWHVVTGLNSQNRECLDEHGRVPNKLSAHIFTDEEYINWSEFEIELYTEDEKPVWLEHPLHKRIVDVIAIKVTIPENQIVTPLEEMIEPFNENTEIRISDDVFILGFPFSIKYGGNFPIWKRASIASEPSVDIDELPKMFLDTASRKGMSGSPVIFKTRRPVTLIESLENDMKVMSRYAIKFVGVYSGRIGTEKNESQVQLGIVWKSQVIDEIIYQTIRPAAKPEDQAH